jgi:glycosyltransferase involved in cell wall biosynthesis
VPVVVRDTPVFREVFGGAVGYASSPRELAAQLVAAAEAPDEGRRAAGRSLAARHTWAAAAEAHLALYRSVLRTPVPAP